MWEKRQLEDKQLQILGFQAFQDNYIWLVIHQGLKQAFVVDPGDAREIISYLQSHTILLTGVFITHKHWDHVSGIEEILKNYPVPVYGAGIEQIPYLSHQVNDGDVIELPGQIKIKVISTPGHTRGHLLYAVDNALFCGDTLFGAGCGRLFEGSIEEMYASLQKISQFPDDTRIYCAHEYTEKNLIFAQHVEPSNQAVKERIRKTVAMRKQGLPTVPLILAEEKRTNPFLRCQSPELIRTLEAKFQTKLQTSIDVFAYTRKWKDDF